MLNLILFLVKTHTSEVSIFICRLDVECSYDQYPKVQDFLSRIHDIFPQRLLFYLLGEKQPWYIYLQAATVNDFIFFEWNKSQFTSSVREKLFPVLGKEKSVVNKLESQIYRASGKITVTDGGTLIDNYGWLIRLECTCWWRIVCLFSCLASVNKLSGLRARRTVALI